MLTIHAAGNGPTVMAKIDVPIIDFINDAEGKLIHTNLLIEIATKHLGLPHHQERMVMFFTQAITIGFGSIKHHVYKARILTAVDAEMRAINQIIFFCCFFSTEYILWYVHPCYGAL
jgi:hypothetical protein